MVVVAGAAIKSGTAWGNTFSDIKTEAPADVARRVRTAIHHDSATRSNASFTRRRTSQAVAVSHSLLKHAQRRSGLCHF